MHNAIGNLPGRGTLERDKTGISPKQAKPFEPGQVSLHKSLFTENRDRDYEYLLSVDNDRMLYNFRAAAGLDTLNARPMDGWDAPDCNLRGHTTGHYMSALAQAYASSDDQRFKSGIDYLVAALGECQDAMAASGRFSPGFLSGYSEEQFDKLEGLAKYPIIWAPYYTLHKIAATAAGSAVCKTPCYVGLGAI